MNIEEFTGKQMREAQTTSITGVVIENKLKGIITIIPCFCVQDSPDNPCPCTDLSKILISKDSLVDDIISLDKKSTNGESLSIVTVDRNANVLVEQTTSVKVENAIAATNRFSLPKPTFPFPFPPSTGPTFPYPDPDPSNPDVVYFWPAVIGAGALLGGAVIGGYYAIRGNNCTTTTTTTESTSPDGTKTTKTVVVKECG